MIIDDSLKLSEAQAVTVSAASTSVLDLGAKGDAYRPPFLVVQTREAAAAVGDATVEFKVQTATDDVFTTPITLFSSGAIGKAALALNSQPLAVRIPAGCKRYLRVWYEVATGPLTAGKFDAFTASEVQTNV